MSEDLCSKFIHRLQDGLIQSFCVRCFKTVGSRTDEVELERDEKMHECQLSPWQRAS